MAKQAVDTTPATVDTTPGLKDNLNPQELGEIIPDWYPDFLNKDDAAKTDAEKAAEYVTMRWASMKLARSTYESVWILNEAAYRVDPGTVDESDDAENWRSTHTAPLTHGMVETAVAEFIDSEPDYEIASQKDSADGGVKTIKKIVIHTRYKGDYDYQKQLALRSLTIYGTAIWWEYYREDPRYIKSLTAYDEKTGKKTYEISKVTEFNDCYGEVVSLWNFGVDENAVTMSEANDCIRREVLKWSDFVRLYGDLDTFAEMKPGGELGKGEPVPRPDGTKDEDEIEILHYYNKPYDSYWIVPNGKLLNEFDSSLPDDHKELPFAEAVFLRMPGHFYGMGIPQIIAGTQGELDSIRRLRLDRAKLNISKVFLTSNREDLTDAEIAMAPGKRIAVNDPTKSIVPLEFSDTGASSYREEERLIEDARWGTGIADNQMSSTGSNITATESAIVKESTLKRLRASLATNKTIFFERIGELRLANILQHYQDPIKVNKITGENGEDRYEAVYRQVSTQEEDGISTLTVKPEDIRGNFTYYVKPMVNIPLSKELEKEQIRQLFDKLITLPTTDPDKATKWLMKGHDYDPADVQLEGIGVPTEKLADSENARMMQGAVIPPTVNATPGHSLRHYKFLTENAWQIDANVGKSMSDHLNGELNPVSPAGIGGITPPVGADGAIVGTPPLPGGDGGAGPLGGGQDLGGGAAPAGLNPAAGGAIPTGAGPDGAPVNPMIGDPNKMSLNEQ